MTHTYEQNDLFSHKSESSQGSERWLSWGRDCHASMNIWRISSIQVKVGLSGISTWSTIEAERKGLWCSCSMRDPDSKYKVEELERWLHDKGHGLLLSIIRAQHTGWLTTACASSSRESRCQMHIPIHSYTDKDTELIVKTIFKNTCRKQLRKIADVNFGLHTHTHTHMCLKTWYSIDKTILYN